MKIKRKKQLKEIKYTSETTNIEQDCKDEVDTIINDRRKNESNLFKSNTDANYFTCVTFNNSQQRDEFFKKLGIELEDHQYINGIEFAKLIGIEIEAESKKAPKSFKISQKALSLTRNIAITSK